METLPTVTSQYHHYIPRFILKNFSHPLVPPKRNPPTDINSQDDQIGIKGNVHQGRKASAGDAVVSLVDLSSEVPKVSEAPVKRTLGMTDMYRDTCKPSSKQHVIEEKLSRLESRAGVLVQKIIRASNDLQRGLWLTRQERNLMRKFLFIMKYRGPTFYQRYSHETAAAYKANDRERLLKYMAEKGFTRPIDVWFDNIDTILDLDMDEELKWISELPKRMFPDDAAWFNLHCQSMYMAICTPSDPKKEFILTDNCYHVFEGPSRVLIDPTTGKSEDLAWTSLHEFAPISPKLVIVLRSFVLPSSLEEGDPEQEAFRKEFRAALESVCGNIDNSLLVGLPISKARNNYTQLVGHRLQFLPHEDGRLRRGHKFFFKFFPISTDYTDRINGLFFDNANFCDNIVFKSMENFRQSLEWYLADTDLFPKLVTGAHGDPKFRCLKKLARISEQLGAKKCPVWERVTVSNVPTFNNEGLKHLKEQLPTLLEAIDDEDPTDFMRTYRTLGGSKEMIPTDFDQVNLMLQLRIKIDAWSVGIDDEQLRHRNRAHLKELYLQLPRRRVWLYLKCFRDMILRDPNDQSFHGDHNPTDGPEDIIAKGNTWRVIKPGKLNEVMWQAAESDIRKWETPVCDQTESKHFAQLLDMAFINGNIGDAGIEQVSRLAEFHHAKQLSNRDSQTWAPDKASLTESQRGELVVRVLVKHGFKAALGDKLEPELLSELEKVLFEVIYPTPPMELSEYETKIVEQLHRCFLG